MPDNFAVLSNTLDTLATLVRSGPITLDDFGGDARAHARECRTLHVSPGRRSGKTRYIQAKLDKGSAVIVPDAHWRNRLYMSRPGVFTARDVSEGRLRGQRLKTVYVDEPAKVFVEISPTEFYRELASATELFFLLGE